MHAVGEYELSLRFLEKALALNIKYYGAKSIKVAVSYHLIARTQSCMGNFRSALNNEKEAYAIYKQHVSVYNVAKPARLIWQHRFCLSFIEFLLLVGGKSRENQRILGVFEASHSTGCRFAEEDE